MPLVSVIGNSALLARIDFTRYCDGEVGEFTLRDILTELDKPGRDPRQSFEPPKFRDDVRELKDLRQGMELEGVVTNITAFGAFVDVGVHQDGLVHISQLADRFVKDPHEVVKVGDRIQVRVLEIDHERQRIALSARRGAPAANGQGTPAGDPMGRAHAAPRPATPASKDRRPPPGTARSPASAVTNNPFAQLLAKGARPPKA